MLRRTLLITIGLLIATAAPAAGQYAGPASLAADDSTVVVSQLLSVTGTGFQANETVGISFTGEVRETATVGIDGEFTADFRIPAGTPGGEQEIVATSESASASTVVTVMVEDAESDGDDGDASGAGGSDDDDEGALAFTGSNTMTLVQVGAGLLAAGGLVLLITRKRQRNPTTA
jgi:LPXTG-motif cell wall-anchored protein